MGSALVILSSESAEPLFTKLQNVAVIVLDVISLKILSEMSTVTKNLQTATISHVMLE